MKTKITCTLAGILAIACMAQSQQNPQPQPQATAIGQQAALPCATAAVPVPKRCGWACREAERMKQRAERELCKKTKGNVCDLPSPTPEDLAKQVQKPCPLPTTARVTAPAPAAVTSPNDNKTMLFCPPNTTKLDGYSYCMKPDHTLVDAIQIAAPSLSNPAPIRAAAPGPAQK